MTLTAHVPTSWASAGRWRRRRLRRAGVAASTGFATPGPPAARRSQTASIMSPTFEPYAELGSCLALAFVVPSLAYAALRAQARLAWPTAVTYEPLDPAEAGPYRGPARPVFGPREVDGSGGPPAVVRAAAFASFFLGQMFLPGLLLGLVGLFYSGLGLLSVPGLVLAWRVFGLGVGLLRRTPGVARRAERAATFAYVLNAVVFAAGFVFTFAKPPLGPVLIGYAFVSIGHGALLRRAAAALRGATALDA
jgi:hypothetical protein